ncbi:type II toxin-antitoxin system VapC family toxin [Moraxella oblonga]|uniref:type II toxin-antitoxin system VapC family toxin n=1 Tax=Moraxella oblonga TaxID=200413 RepID=UPI00082ACE25|nr:type II toxin-antitoxin system VapC family toxin [Moraxella oblonga]
MNYLLDTHIALWLIQNHEKLNKEAKSILLNPQNKIWFSVVNIWEMSIKHKKGDAQKEIIEPNLFYQSLLERNYKQLDINAYHTLAVKDLPLIHKDPFDRMLIAQAMSENLILMTADEKIEQYPNLNLYMI